MRIPILRGDFSECFQSGSRRNIVEHVLKQLAKLLEDIRVIFTFPNALPVVRKIERSVDQSTRSGIFLGRKENMERNICAMGDGVALFCQRKTDRNRQLLASVSRSGTTLDPSLPQD